MSKIDEDESFKVYIRVRPLLEKEKNLMKTLNKNEKNILTIDENTITTIDLDNVIKLY